MSTRMNFDIRKAETSDINAMLGIFKQAFEHEDFRPAQLMYTEVPSSEALELTVEDILMTHLDSQDCSFMVAYENSNGENYEFSEMDNQDHSEEDAENREDSETDTRNLTFGWISVSVVPRATAVYAGSELNTYACLEVLERAQAMEGNDLDTSDPRFRLLRELHNRSMLGQGAHITEPHLIVNALVCWPDLHRDIYSDLATKLLGNAVRLAQGHGLPIWAQIPENQEDIFLQAGFIQKFTFTLNLNNYKPSGSTSQWGAHKWLQMVYEIEK